MLFIVLFSSFFFFFNDTATTEIYTLSLHDALPIFPGAPRTSRDRCARSDRAGRRGRPRGSPGRPSARAVPQEVEVVLLAARFLRLLDADAAEHAFPVDDERPPLRVSGLADEHAILLRDVAFRVEVREQSGGQALVAFERLQAPAVVHRHADHRRILAFVVVPPAGDLLQLLRADGREGRGEEEDHHVAPAEAGEARRLAFLVEQLEIRRDVSHLEHVASPMGAASQALDPTASGSRGAGGRLLHFPFPSAALRGASATGGPVATLL